MSGFHPTLWSAQVYARWDPKDRRDVAAMVLALLIDGKAPADRKASALFRLGIMLGPDDALELVRLLEGP